ncbi:MAG: transporter, fusion protein [Sporomusa sp.]|jgi:TRAP transporter 4TM/12TM fusion protein|nr:transporter, fusion protein [Sporomusa sp.]
MTSKKNTNSEVEVEALQITDDNLSLAEAEKRSKIRKNIITVLAVGVSLFHILNVTGLFVMSTMTIRIVHLMVMMVLAFLTVKKKNTKFDKINTVLSYLGIAVTVFSSVYLLIRWEAISNSGGVTNQMDIIVGIIMVIVVLDSARQSVDWSLSLICGLFLIYPFVGQFMPSLLRTRAYSLERVSSFLFTSTEGIYGTPISVSANYIIVFCVFGAFLSEFGAGQFLYELAAVATKRLSAASAKASIIFSALIGMISGSAAGNVAITGTLTIPMMTKDGYSKDQAGAISAVAATGGQIMPPVMGAAAFIMASIVGVPYATVMKTAAVPSILYFASIFIIVHLLAKKQNIAQVNQNKIRPFKHVMSDGWPYAIPIILLIVLMVGVGYSPFKSAVYSMLSLVIVYALNELVRNKKLDAKDLFSRIGRSLKSGAIDTVSIATACGAAGILAGVISLTGVGSKLSLIIETLSGGNLFIALFLTMIISIILGLGLPTTACYLILASVAAPALVGMGAPVLAAHMFVFYYGCVSTITPPVALAAYVAAGISKSDPNRTGWLATFYGLISYVLPFAFVLDPSLFLEGAFVAVTVSIVTSLIGTVAIGMSIVGYTVINANVPIRIILFAAGILTMSSNGLMDLAGVTTIAIILAHSYIQKSKKLKGETV